MSCQCGTCAFGNRLRDLRDKLPDQKDKDLVDETYSRLEHAETDAAYWQAKYDGTWPTDEEEITPHEARRRLWRAIIEGVMP